jgi:hypothetical protein
MNHTDLMNEWCTGQQWDRVPMGVQTEIMAEMLRTEGFDAVTAATAEPRMASVFTHLLADMIEARYADAATFAEAGRKFAAAACSLLMRELDGQCEYEWETVLAEYESERPEAGDYAEAQARHRDYVAMVQP